MFKNDRMMTIFTGLILAVFAGTMVQYGDRFMAMISGENQIQTSDDFYSVRAGSNQVLDVLANDEIIGPIVVVDLPRCGTVALSGSTQLLYSSDNSCTGEVSFTYCVDSTEGCVANKVSLNVISLSNAQTNAQPDDELVPDQEASVETPPPGPAENQASDPAPVVVVTVAPDNSTGQTTEPAPSINNIIVSMQAPTLVAPNIDEFVTPNVATASIRRQNTRLDDSAQNTDSSIAPQSSAETVAPVEFGVAGFNAPLASNDSNILIGGGPTETPVINTASSPQLSTTSPEANPVNAPLERGPIALAQLPETTQTPFGDLKFDGQFDTNIVASTPINTFSPEGGDTNMIAKVETGQAILAIEQSGTTALIALQLSGPPLSSAHIQPDNTQLLALQGEQDFSAQHTPPISLANTSFDSSSPVVLEREPTAVTLGPQFADGTSWGQANPPGTGILPVQTPQGVEIASIISLDVPVQSGGYVSDQTMATAGGVKILTNQGFVQEQDGALELEMLATASLGLSVDPMQRFEPVTGIGPKVDFTGILPQIDKSPAAMPQTELASLTPQENTQTGGIGGQPVPQLSTCEIFLDPSVRAGANILLFLIAECKPNMPVTISHAGMDFTILTDTEGSANVMVPALQRNAQITATFEDGSTETTIALVAQITDVTRAAVTWRGDANLDLHAFEYGAAPGSAGHIWSGAARDYRSARLKGGGYLVSLGDSTIQGGAMAEVYTMPLGRSVARGTVSMTLEVENGADVCGSDISARTIRTRPDNSAGLRRIRFTVPGCGGGALATFRVAGAVDDIRLAAQ